MEKAGNIRLIACDMDGTLLKDDKTVSPKTLDMIREAGERNIAFTICSGRIPTMLEYYIRELGLQSPAVTTNGAVIWDVKNLKPLDCTPMDLQEAREILDFCTENRLDCSVLTLGTCYFSPGSIRRKRFEQYNRIAASGGLHAMQLDTYDPHYTCIRGAEICKMLIYENRPGDYETAEGFLKTLSRTEYTSSDPGLLDLSFKGVTKGYGLRRLADILHLSREEICAFGDFYNDLSMMEFAGFPVAMKNGCDEIKAVASVVTDTNEADGVEKAVRKYIFS